MKTGFIADVQKKRQVTTRMVMDFVWLRCRAIIDGTVDLIKKLGDEVETD